MTDFNSPQYVNCNLCQFKNQCETWQKFEGELKKIDRIAKINPYWQPELCPIIRMIFQKNLTKS